MHLFVAADKALDSLIMPPNLSDGPEYAVGPSSPLEKTLPLLLPHLSPADHLTCFRTSKSISEAVLTYANTTYLTTTGTNTASSLQAQCLAIHAHTLSLSIHDGLMRPAAFLWQQIAVLHLQAVRLVPANLSHRGQLHLLPRLHSLHLHQCCLDAQANDDPASGPLTPPHTAQQPFLKIHTLSCTCCKPTSAAYLRLLLPLLAPGHLRTLVTDDRNIIHYLPVLPGLQELHLLAQVNNEEIDVMMGHPQLKHVVMKSCLLREDRANISFSWETLDILDGTSLRALGALPLAHIRTCTIHHRLCVRHMPHTSTGGVFTSPLTTLEVDLAIANLERCTRMIWRGADTKSKGSQPRMGNYTGAGVWTGTGLDGFELELFGCSASETQRLLTLASRCLSGSALVLSAARHLSSPLLRDTLAMLPASLSTVCFKCHNSLIGGDVLVEGPGGEAGEGVVSRMPHHVTHVVLAAKEEMGENVMWEGLLRMYVMCLSRPITLTLYDEPSAPWTEARRANVTGWLAKHTNHVQVEFRYLEL